MLEDMIGDIKGQAIRKKYNAIYSSYKLGDMYAGVLKLRAKLFIY